MTNTRPDTPMPISMMPRLQAADLESTDVMPVVKVANPIGERSKSADLATLRDFFQNIFNAIHMASGDVTTDITPGSMVLENGDLNTTLTPGTISTDNGTFKVRTEGGYLKVQSADDVWDVKVYPDKVLLDYTASGQSTKTITLAIGTDGKLDITGDVQVSKTMYVEKGLDVGDGSISAKHNLTLSDGSVQASGNITSTSGGLSVKNDITSTSGGLSVKNDITSTSGGVSAAGDISTSGGDLVTSTGNVDFASWRLQSGGYGAFVLSRKINNTYVSKFSSGFDSGASSTLDGGLTINNGNLSLPSGYITSGNVVLATGDVNLLGTPYSNYPAGVLLTIVNNTPSSGGQAINVTWGTGTTYSLIKNDACQFVKNVNGWIRVRVADPA